MGFLPPEGFWNWGKNEVGSVRQWTRRCLEAKFTWLVIKSKGKECWVQEEEEEEAKEEEVTGKVGY